MADKAKLPVPSASCSEPQPRISASTDLLRRAEQALPRATLLDPVESWKRLALASALHTAPPLTAIARSKVKVTLASILVCLLAGALLGLIGALAALTLASGVALWAGYRDRCDAQSGAVAKAERADAHLQQTQPLEALRLAQDALDAARGQQLRARVLKTLAWGAIGARDPFLAHGTIAQLAPDAIDLHLIASYLDSCNRCDEAVELLMRARSAGHRSHGTTKLLIDVLFRLGQPEEARRVATADQTLLNAEEQQVIKAALRCHR